MTYSYSFAKKREYISYEPKVLILEIIKVILYQYIVIRLQKNGNIFHMNQKF